MARGTVQKGRGIKYDRKQEKRRGTSLSRDEVSELHRLTKNASLDGLHPDRQKALASLKAKAERLERSFDVQG